MSSTSMLLPTPLGDLEFLAHVVGTSPTEAHLRTVRLQPRLPPDLSVAGCHAVVLQVRSPGEIESVSFRARRPGGASVTSDVEAGEGMEARTWWSDTRVLSVGTEDWDALRLRFDGRIRLTVDPVVHFESGLELRIGAIPAGEPLSLHFVVAWNPMPEPQESSCWYAVDQRHAAVLAALDGR